jgi:O-antigen ligase
MMIVASIHEVNDVRIIVWAYILMGVWIAYEPVTNYIQGVVVVTGYGGVAYGRFGAAAGHVALANTLSQSLPLTYFQAAVEKNRNLKLILYGAMLLMVAGIFASRSRGGFVGLTVFIMGVYLFTKKKTRGLIVLTVVILLAVFLGDELYWNRVSTISQGISSGRSANERYLGLINGISMMVKRPLFGVGIGCYAEARRQYFNYYFYSHNLYGELFGELGLASAVWFYWIYIIMKKAKRIKNNIEENQFGNQLLVHERGNYLQNILMGVQVGIVVRLVLGLGSHSAFIWFWFMMAGLVSAIEIMEKNKNLLVEG